jgi:beta-lactamase superfamily II metal-dependent hydrolase
MSGVTVRMYNTGFGDCFLLTFPAPDRPRKVLIDCGRHTSSKGGPKLTRVVEQVLADVQEAGGPRLDVVICTHRHQDHVEGFDRDGWGNVTVGEVWMPWTEHPTDSLARGICDRQSTRAQRLHMGISALAMNAGDQAHLLSYAGNNLVNAEAMKLLHEGFLGKPLRRFLPDPAPAGPRLLTSVLPGVETWVLGPSRDPEVMKEMEPPREESYLRAQSLAAMKPEDRPAPFDPRWEIDRATYEERSRTSLRTDLPPDSEPFIGALGDDNLLEAAARLEEAVNATSLVLLFHIGQAWLLFPGDAQWGTWNAILNNGDAAGILGKLTFYKVGHHGSHNATPRSFVERFVNSQVRLMLPFSPVARWPSIPKQSLLDLFASKQAALARSDQSPAEGSPFRATLEGADVLYIDYEVPV